jgi:hypothetical protein
LIVKKAILKEVTRKHFKICTNNITLKKNLWSHLSFLWCLFILNWTACHGSKVGNFSHVLFEGTVSVLSVYALIVSRSFKRISLCCIILTFLFASLKCGTYSENAYWNPHQNSLLSIWLMFSSVGPSLAAVKMRQI